MLRKQLYRSSTLLFITSTLLIAQNMEWEWIKSATGDADARCVTVDDSNSIYIAGSFLNQITLDNLSLTSINYSSDIYLIKLDNEGNVLWGKSIKGEWTEYCRKVDTDPQGNVILAGEFCSNTATIDSITLINTHQTPFPDESTFDIFIVKFNSEGDLLWAKSGGGIYHEHANSVCTDHLGNVFIFGNFMSPVVTFDNLSLYNTGNLDLMLIKYDRNGNATWAKSAIGSGQENAWSVKTDLNNNVYIAGSYRSSSISFDNFTLINSSNYFDLYLVKYNPNGSVIWVKSASGEKWDDANAISVDEENNVYLAGHFNSDTLYFDSTTLYLSNIAHSNIDMYILKLNSTGNIVWAKNSTGSAWIYPHSVSTHGANHIAIVGTFTGNNFGNTEYFGTNAITTFGSYDIFLVNYDSSGNAIWCENFGGTNMDFGQDICYDNMGNLIIAAFFQSDSFTFDSLTFINNYNSKMLVAKKRDSSPSTIKRSENLSQKYALTNYPNPFNLSTTIEFTLPKATHATLKIYNILGEEVATLISENLAAGSYLYQWETRGLASGVYFYKLEAGNPSKSSGQGFVQTKKMLLIR
jgi:hypothetical protein